MIDNAATQLLAACEEVFNAAWQNEVARYKAAYELYKKAKQDAAESSAKHGLYSIRATSAETFLLRALTGNETAKPWELKATASATFKQLCYLLYRADPEGNVKGSGKGIDFEIEKERKDYLEGVTHKLKLALEKKEIHNHKQATCITVSSSAVGFKVRAIVDGLSFITDCIGAGGYNIQCFHYRYLIKF